MINPKSPCYFLLELNNNAAENVVSILSPSVMGDIERGFMLSKDYQEDISGALDLEDTVNYIETLSAPEHIIKREDILNPLYFPNKKETVLETFEEGEDGATMKFTAMEGNLFAIRSIKIDQQDGNYLKGALFFKPFKLPSIEEIQSTQSVLLN